MPHDPFADRDGSPSELGFAQTHGRFQGLKALVVEDETIVAFLIEDMLTELGCETVWLANNVSSAMSILGENRPDIVVLDVNLAGSDAYTVAEHLSREQIPFIFATGYGREGISNRWARRPVIQKPFQFEGLEQALRAALDDKAAPLS
jgi:CheY-like chemotaxis protein